MAISWNVSCGTRRYIAAVSLVAFAGSACRRAEGTLAPSSSSSVSPSHPTLDCAIWAGVPAGERRTVALSALEGALHDAADVQFPEVAGCVLGRVPELVVSYTSACSRAASAMAPIDIAFKAVLDECAQLALRAKPAARPPLQKDSAPPLVCPPGATSTTVGNGSAELCSRPDQTLDGPAREWFPSGSQRSDDSWANGKKVGVWFSWSKEGACSSATSYADGQRDGPEVFWFANGTRRALTYYVAGRKSGPIAEWSESGRPIVLGGFENDLKSGFWYFRTPDAAASATRIFFERGEQRDSQPATFPAR